VIFPVPSAKRGLPEAAIDRLTYPPYHLVWCLEVFSKKDETFVTEVVLERFDVAALRRLFRRPPSDPMIEGGWPIAGRHRSLMEALTGQKLDLRLYTYFIEASAINYYEVNR